MPYNNIHTLFRRNIFGDGSNGRPLPQPPILLMVKTKTNSSFTVKVAERSNRSFSAELMNYLFQTSALFNMWQCNEQNLIDCIYDCVCLTKCYQYIFSVSVKFGPYYITSQRGEFIKKMLLNAFIYFFGIFFCFFFLFFIIKFVFLSFSFLFFDEVSNFRNRILTNQKHESTATHCQRNCMKHMKKVRSNQASISINYCTDLAKTQFSLVIIVKHFKIVAFFFTSIKYQKQPSSSVLIKSCSENMQQSSRKTPMPKCDFNKVAKQLNLWTCFEHSAFEHSLKGCTTAQNTEISSDFLVWNFWWNTQFPQNFGQIAVYAFHQYIKVNL